MQHVLLAAMRLGKSCYTIILLAAEARGLRTQRLGHTTPACTVFLPALPSAHGSCHMHVPAQGVLPGVRLPHPAVPVPGQRGVGARQRALVRRQHHAAHARGAQPARPVGRHLDAALPRCQFETLADSGFQPTSTSNTKTPRPVNPNHRARCTTAMQCKRKENTPIQRKNSRCMLRWHAASCGQWLAKLPSRVDPSTPG